MRFLHMLDAARDVGLLAKGRSSGELSTDMPLRRAMIHAIQEIGEAAARVSPTGRARAPGLPWPQIIAMRNRLVHAYNDVDVEVMWRVATEEVPTLARELASALAAWPEPRSP